MLPIAALVIIGGSIFIIVKAPDELRMAAIALVFIGAGLGFGVGYLIATDGDTRTYYPVAGAMGGWIVGAGIYDHLRKKHVAKTGSK